MKSTFPLGHRFPLKQIIGAAILVWILLYSTGRFTPPMFGRVVDAVTHRSISGINVVVEESHYEGWAIHTEAVRATTTKWFGLFFLFPTYHWDPGGPLSSFRAYWLTVNEDKHGESGGEEGSAENIVLYNPMFDRGGWAIGNRNYFPLTITFNVRGCNRIWDATCSFKWLWWGISVPLVPVLDDPKVCDNISNSDKRENCRQLNTYHGAFVHIDSYEQVQQGKLLCSEVDHGIISRECIQELPTYIAMAYTYSPQFHAPAHYEPIPPGMFPDNLFGIPVISDRHCGPRLLFSGRLLCIAHYGPETNQLVNISIEEFPDPADSQGPIEWNPHFAEPKHGTVSYESLPEGDVYRYRGPQYNSFLWYSGKKHIQVTFSNPIPQMQEIVSYYLKLFPSSLL